MKKLFAILLACGIFGCSHDWDKYNPTEKSVNACSLTLQDPVINGEYLGKDLFELYFDVVDCVCATPGFYNETRVGGGASYCYKGNSTLDQRCADALENGKYSYADMCTEIRHVTDKAINDNIDDGIKFSDECLDLISECRNH